jgi:DNA processing protein
VELGITIVSGLAMGIDTVAHKATLENRGRTIGVLGNGIDYIYPKNNYQLYRDVAEKGCLMTEFPMGTKPINYNFPQRNRIISGLSLGVIVIEAREKSGSLITAHHALEQGKDVFALPGNINSIYSQGTNRLIRDGAKPLLCLDDILEEVYELTQMKINKKQEYDYSSLSDDEIKIMKIISNGPIHADTIVLQSEMDISNVMSILTILELKGMIRELSGRIFCCC